MENSYSMGIYVCLFVYTIIALFGDVKWYQFILTGLIFAFFQFTEYLWKKHKGVGL